MTPVRCVNQMKPFRYQCALAAALGATLVTSATGRAFAQAPLRVASPDGKNEMIVELREGVLHYGLRRGGQPVILPSRLGFEFRNARALRDSLRIVGASRRALDTTWTQP